MWNLCQKTRCDRHSALFGSSPHPLSFMHLQRLYIRIVAVYRQKFLQYTGEACRQRAIRLRYLPGACFDRSPVGVERCDGPLARLSLHLDIPKTGHAEQVCKPPRIGQRKPEVERGALLGEMATERVGKDAPHRCPIRGGDDADGGTPARTENASELRETPRGIREEL